MGVRSKTMTYQSWTQAKRGHDSGLPTTLAEAPPPKRLQLRWSLAALLVAGGGWDEVFHFWGRVWTKVHKHTTHAQSRTSFQKHCCCPSETEDAYIFTECCPVLLWLPKIAMSLNQTWHKADMAPTPVKLVSTQGHALKGQYHSLASSQVEQWD